MTRFPTFALATVLAGALTLPVLAQTTAPAQPPAPAPAGAEAAPDRPAPGFWGRKHGERHWGQRGERMRGHGPMGMAGAMLTANFDENGDGVVTRAELDDGLDSLVGTHDTDGDGALSLDEFAELYAEVTRPLTVRAFQWIDSDGDGSLSAEEQAKARTILGKRLPTQAPDKAAD